MTQTIGYNLNGLPSRLFSAYDWTANASELEELRDLTDSAAISYAVESWSNARDHDVYDVSADDLLALRAWLQTYDDGTATADDEA